MHISVCFSRGLKQMEISGRLLPFEDTSSDLSDSD